MARYDWASGDPTLKEAIAAGLADAGAGGPVAAAIATAIATEVTNRNTAVASAIATEVTNRNAAIVAAGATATINTQVGNYTLVLTDAGKIILITDASAEGLTVPPNSSVAFPVGTRVKVVQDGAGLVTITAGGGVTLHQVEATLKSLGEYAVIELLKIATDTWVVYGDLAAS